MTQTYIDTINERTSKIQDTFRLTDEEIGRFVRHRGSEVRTGGWNHSFYWSGTTEKHRNSGWSEQAVLKEVYGCKSEDDIFLTHLACEGMNGLYILTPVYAWRRDDTQYSRILTTITKDGSIIWSRDVEGDTSIYENQVYVENELRKQFQDRLGTLQESLAYPFTSDAITDDPSKKFDPNEMLEIIRKYLERIA